jgi:hypothetical protein
VRDLVFEIPKLSMVKVANLAGGGGFNGSI